MSYLFSEGLETGDVLRIGQDTVSVEYHGDGPKWRILDDGTSDPIYPWFSIREISELTNEDIERIGDKIKLHLKERRTAAQRKHNKLLEEACDISDKLDKALQRKC
jgi:hypothetical protein